MKLYSCIFAFSVVVISANAGAQEMPPLMGIDEPDTETAIENVEVNTQNQNGIEENNPSVFDNMMESLFGKSSLPNPQGSLENATTEPAPLFADENSIQPLMQDNQSISAPQSQTTEVMINPQLMNAQPVMQENILPPVPVQLPVVQNVNNPKVATFDIAGIKLKMSPKDVVKEARSNGYKLDYVDKTAVNFIKWGLEKKCMDAGIFVYEQKQKCINDNAKKTGDYFINYMEFVKNDNKEKIRTFFTSPFAGNKLYRVTYYNEGDNSLGDSKASNYIKDKRKNEFYSWVMNKYGQPTNPQTMVWGVGSDTPYFTVSTSGGAVNFNMTLENPAMPFEDAQAMRKADAKSTTYSKFSF